MSMSTAPSTLEHLSRAFTSIPFNKMLGLTLDHMDHDYISMSFHMKNDLIGNFMHGILHGGVISSVLDMAGGVAIMLYAVSKNPTASMEELAAILGKSSTIDLQISYLNPGRGDVFTAKAYLVKGGNSISFARMELHNQAGTLIATGNGTYKMG